MLDLFFFDSQIGHYMANKIYPAKLANQNSIVVDSFSELYLVNFLDKPKFQMNISPSDFTTRLCLH